MAVTDRSNGVVNGRRHEGLATFQSQAGRLTKLWICEPVGINGDGDQKVRLEVIPPHGRYFTRNVGGLLEMVAGQPAQKD